LAPIPWQRGTPLTWDVTLADSYGSAAARSGGAAAEHAGDGKSAKYDQSVKAGCLFQPIAAETLGPLNESAILFFAELGRKIAAVSAFFFSAYLSSSSNSILSYEHNITHRFSTVYTLTNSGAIGIRYAVN